MQFKRADNIRLVVRKGVLDHVFDECDRYDRDETGGRIIGTVAEQSDGTLVLDIQGVISAGPNAKRSPGSLFQDGDYQERAFRSIEDAHPGILPLGSWHTHHVNGYPTLSQGDVTTYERTVNHENHPLDCFYALLVTQRVRGRKRYHVRHYVMLRGDGQHVYEIDRAAITLQPKPALTPELNPDGEQDATHGVRHRSDTPPPGASHEQDAPSSNPARAEGHEILSALYPGLVPFRSKKLGTVYWRGVTTFADGRRVNALVLEQGPSSYSAKVEDITSESTAPWFALRKIERAILEASATERNVGPQRKKERHE